MKTKKFLKIAAAVVVFLGVAFIATVQLVIGVGGLLVASTLGGSPSGDIPEAILALVRRWRGTIAEKFANVNSLVNLITANQPQWTIATPVLRQLTEKRDELQALINLCESPAASLLDRAKRDALLKSTIDICLKDIKLWAYSLYAGGILTVEDVHSLGFLLPFERGGRHGKSMATNAIAVVKVVVISTDVIRVTIDQSAGENAAQVKHGWPTGVGSAVIIITAEDGVTEVYNKSTTLLHNDIEMPKGSHGKTFFVKASFLKHLNDTPRFGNRAMVTMPKTAEDFAAEKNN